MMKSGLWSTGRGTLAGVSRLLATAVVLACWGADAQVAQSTPKQPTFGDFETFDAAKFTHSTRIDNPWLPMRPATQLIYEGFTTEEGKRVPHRVVYTVTDLTKVIGGVRTVVGYDMDYSAGRVEEKEIIFYAQDNDGNVWHLGQYPEVYEGGKFVAAPTWIHGVEDGKAGIMMLADPRIGSRNYSEGLSLSVNWTDRGEVYQVGKRTCVPAGCYDDVLVIEETSREEPGARHLKYYARGVGYVRVGWRGEGDKTQETLELVKVVQLGQQDMARVRAAALQLEKRAYKFSKKVYAQTAPSGHTPATVSQ